MHLLRMAALAQRARCPTTWVIPIWSGAIWQVGAAGARVAVLARLPLQLRAILELPAFVGRLFRMPWRGGCESCCGPQWKVLVVFANSANALSRQKGL